MSFLFKKWGNKRNSIESPTSQEHMHNNNTNTSRSSTPPSSPPQGIKPKQPSSLDEDEFYNLEKSPRSNNESNLSPLVPVSTSPLHEPFLDNDETLYNNWIQNDKKNKNREEKSSNQNNNTSNTTTSNTNNNLSQRLTTKDVQKYTTHNPTNNTITISTNSPKNSNNSAPQSSKTQTSPRSSTSPPAPVKTSPQVQPPPPPKLKASTLPPKSPKNSFVCPVCNTILHTSDETAVNFHVDECLAKSMNANTVSAPSKRSTLPSQSRSNHGYRDEDSPFLIACPYIGCGQKMEARDFYNHAILQHSTAAQGYACPICFLAGIRYAPRSDTNLLTHLQHTHSDLAAVPQVPSTIPNQQGNPTKPYPPSNDDFEDYDPADFLVDDVVIRDNDIVVATPDIKSLGSKYVEDTMKDAKPGVECTICFEEFENGVTIARMDCFCVFHKNCIDAWLKKAKKCPLHQD